MQYDFSRFSPSSFQRFAQAIALQAFGPGLQVYGSGPDGGRDATFTGKPLYPSDQDPWHGYTVIQAKAKEKLTHDAKDADWLVEQIKREQQKWFKQKLSPKPDYYLIVTNVSLSPMPTTVTSGGKTKKGGLEKVHAALKAFGKALKIKQCDVWAADKLATFLDSAPDSVRSKYAAWVTPSELLWQILTERQGPDFAKVMARAAAYDLRENKFTRLQEAGHSNEDNTLLSRVFVDLPVALTEMHRPIRRNRMLPHAVGVPQAEPTVAEELVRVASNAYGQKYSAAPQSDDSGSDCARVVLLGGPGQGKSTVGQFITQLLQARFLSAPNAPGVSRDVTTYAQGVVESAAAGGINTDAPYRIPVRITLPTFADEIADKRRSKPGSRLSLLEFVANRLSQQSASDVSIDRLRKWLPEGPWLFVLDGLDEVPSSGERPAVLLEIEALFDELAIAQCDAVVLVTTRPQGYNRDLDPQLWRHWRLLPLSGQHALAYAARIAEIRLTEPERRKRVLDRLKAASESPATSQLMVSPLQVAILFTLVDLKGDVPTDRWNLFDRYFSVLRDREEAKGGPSGELLRRHRSSVELIHHHAGFLLHVEAERSGKADSYLSEDEFERLVSTFLSEEGHEGAELRALTQRLSKLATERLVLLATRVEGRIAFDVRSLQEFMAAAMITADKDQFVEARLRAIAAKSHWRHVFQIAASRCFYDTGKRHLANTVISICTELDAGHEDVSDRLAKSGARLAIDLLVDGIGAEAPKQKRILFDRALQAIDLGPSLFDKRLARIVDNILAPHAREALQARIKAHGSRPALAAWVFLFELAGRGVDWAVPLARERWPDSPADSRSILGVIDAASCPDVLLPLVSSTVKESSYSDLLEVTGGREWVRRVFDSPNLLGFDQEHDIQIPMLDEQARSRARIVPLSAENSLSVFKGLDLPKWRMFTSCANFLAQPTPDSLSKALHSCAADWDSAWYAAGSLPWPIAGLIRSAANASELKLIAAAASAGEFGDTRAWQAAEERWAEKGIRSQDLEYWVTTNRFFGSEVATVGAAIIETIRSAPTQGKHAANFDLLFDYFERATGRLTKIRLSYLGLAELEEINDSERLSRAYDLVGWLKATDAFIPIGPFVRYLLDLKPERVPAIDLPILDALEIIGRNISLKSLALLTKYRREPNDKARDEIARYYADDRKRRGILPFVLLLSGDGTRREQVVELSLDLEHDPSDTPAIRYASDTLSLYRRSASLEDVQAGLRGIVLEASVDDSDELSALVTRTVESVFRLRTYDSLCIDATAKVISDFVGAKEAELLIPILRTALDARHTELEKFHCWSQLGLPSSLFDMLATRVAP